MQREIVESRRSKTEDSNQKMQADQAKKVKGNPGSSSRNIYLIDMMTRKMSVRSQTESEEEEEKEEEDKKRYERYER